MRGRAGPGRRGLLLVRRQQRREQQRQDHHHRTRLLHLQRRQRGAELVQQAVRGRAPRRHRAADRGLLREPDHQGPAGRQRRRHAEPGPARQPERAAGRGHRPAPPAQRPARLHHQRLLPRRHPGVHLPGQAVLLPDRHELGGPVLQQGDAQSGRPPAAHDLGRAGRRRQEADQAAGLRDGLRRHRRRAVDLAARAVLLEQRGQPDQGGHACRSSRPCSSGSTWSRTVRPRSPC